MPRLSSEALLADWEALLAAGLGLTRAAAS